jgi:6-phosphofructokinase 1
VARFVALTTRESACDTWCMRLTDPIKLVEVAGRYAGWLPGSAWLARDSANDAPHLVYVPERPVPLERIVEDVRGVYERLGWCVVVLCENQADPSGRVIGAAGEPRWVDSFGHAYFDSPAEFLARAIQERLGVRVRFDKPGTIQRSALGYVSEVDRAEAESVGRAAVRLALDGRSGVMATIERVPGPAYAVTTGSVPLSVVANAQRLLPDEFINQTNNGLTQAFVEYALPLLGPLPPPPVRF